VSRGLPYVEIDRWLWRPDWRSVDADVYAAAHDRAIARPTWIMDGLGRQESMPARLARATEIILVDMPLWIHFWLAAERQIAWGRSSIQNPPAGASTPPPTEALFRTIWEVEQTWMPALRRLVEAVEAAGKNVVRIETLDRLNALLGECAPDDAATGGDLSSRAGSPTSARRRASRRL
jgi:hypothetical protein